MWLIILFILIVIAIIVYYTIHYDKLDPKYDTGFGRISKTQYLNNLIDEKDTLEEMCQLPRMSRLIIHPQTKLSAAENNILTGKHYYGRNAYPITIYKKQDRTKRLLKNPRFNTLFPDPILFPQENSSYIYIETMERILKKACGEFYEDCHQSALQRKNQKVKAAMYRLSQEE